jgi:hypothetical protein
VILVLLLQLDVTADADHLVVRWRCSRDAAYGVSVGVDYWTHQIVFSGKPTGWRWAARGVRPERFDASAATIARGTVVEMRIPLALLDRPSSPRQVQAFAMEVESGRVLEEAQAAWIPWDRVEAIWTASSGDLEVGNDAKHLFVRTKASTVAFGAEYWSHEFTAYDGGIVHYVRDAKDASPRRADAPGAAAGGGEFRIPLALLGGATKGRVCGGRTVVAWTWLDPLERYKAPSRIPMPEKPAQGDWARYRLKGEVQWAVVGRDGENWVCETRFDWYGAPAVASFVADPAGKVLSARAGAPGGTGKPVPLAEPETWPDVAGEGAPEKVGDLECVRLESAAGRFWFSPAARYPLFRSKAGGIVRWVAGGRTAVELVAQGSGATPELK